MRMIVKKNGRIVKEVKVKDYGEAVMEFAKSLQQIAEKDRSKLIPP